MIVRKNAAHLSGWRKVSGRNLHRMFNFNILHLLTVAAALGAALALRREVTGRSLTPGRLFLAPGLALTAAVLLLATTPPPLRHPNLWLAALAVGLVAGSARGLMAPLQVDRLWDRLRLPAGRDGVWVGYALALVTLVVLSLDAAGIALSAWPDLAGNLLAATSAGFLGGRAGSLWLRSLSAPHDTWRTL